MNWLLILLCAVILFSSGVKISLMPLKISITWVLFLGMAGFSAAIMFSRMSRLETFNILNIAEISMLEFIELLIMSAYIFSQGIVKRILAYYPGLMVLAPVSVFAYLFIGMFPGMDFTLAGIMTSCSVSLLLVGLILLLRYLTVDENVLYKTVLVTAVVNIAIYGLL